MKQPAAMASGMGAVKCLALGLLMASEASFSHRAEHHAIARVFCWCLSGFFGVMFLVFIGATISVLRKDGK